MTIPKSILFMLAASVFLGVNQTSAGEQEWSPTEREIWALEEQYMTMLSKKDLEGLSQLWHEDFIGWPSHSAEPVDRSTAQASLEDLFHRLDIVGSAIRPRAMYRSTDMAEAYYTVIFQVRSVDGTLAAAAYRIVHVWIKDHGGWKVVGGMSAAIDVAE